MTHQQEIIFDSNYIPLHNHGFIGLIDTMGDDAAIVQGARTSYGKGTKSVREDRGLIRYLLRHQHTSPFEQCEVKFHIKLPIFVMRQLVRHRIASLNEWSGRYSVMTDEFYIPTDDYIAPQSTDNKQGRGGAVDAISKHGVKWLMKTAHDHSYEVYGTLLAMDGATVYDAYDGEDPLLTKDFPGIARESARTVLPVSNYTECYWKIDLLNLFKTLKLRQDGHAQQEIRDYADAMFQLAQPLFPAAFEAYVDYMKEAITLSRMDQLLLKDAIGWEGGYPALEASFEGEKGVAEAYEMSLRELRDLKAVFFPTA